MPVDVETRAPEGAAEENPEQSEGTSKENTQQGKRNRGGASEEEAEARTSGNFFLRLQEFPAERWDNDLLLYLYRKEPKRSDGSTSYIVKVQEPVDEDWIKARYGSGRYQCRLNEADRGKKAGKSTGKNKPVEVFTFVIEDPNFPPVMPGDKTWMKDPANARWAWDTPQAAGPALASGMSAEQTLRFAEDFAKRYNAAGGKPAEIEKAIVDALAHANKTAIDMVREQQLAGGKSELVPLLAALAPLALAFMNRPAPPDNTKEIVSLVVELLKKDKPAPALDPSVQIQNMATAMVALRGLFLPETTTPANKWDVLREVATGIPQALHEFNGVLGNLQRMKPPGAGTDPPPGAEKKAAQVAAGEVSDEMKQFVAFIAKPLSEAIARGDHGGDFAQWLIDGYGKDIYEQVRGQGRENILAALESYPPLWEKIGEAAVLSDFIDQFVQGPETSAGE